MERRKEKDPLHAPHEPEADELPVEPEMNKGLQPDQSSGSPDPGSDQPSASR